MMDNSGNTLLVIPRIRVQNANAFSSAITLGFPAVTGFMGAVHALERKVRAKGFNVRFSGVGIISHKAQVQTLQHSGAYQRALIGKAHVMNKDGSGKSFIPDGRVHLCVSLVVKCDIEGAVEYEEFIQYLAGNALKTSRLAGGDILGYETPYLAFNQSASMARKTLNKLMPGYALLDRSDLMREAMAQGQDALDALLAHVAIHHRCDEVAQPKDGDDVMPVSATWQAQRLVPGWIVPVAVGFQGLTQPGKAKHVRDDSYPHRFAESIVSLGEFKMVHKVEGLDELLWRYDTKTFNDLYLCATDTALQNIENTEKDNQ